MSTTVAIGVRGGPQTKSRLAPVLGPGQRIALVEAMLADMLASLAGQPGIDRILVTTPTPSLAHLAAGMGASPILEARGGDLNTAFEQVRRRVGADAPQTMLVLLPGDLPLVSASDIRACVADGAADRLGVAAGADGGTGGLAFRAHVPLPLAFGPDSARRHAEAGRALGLRVDLVEAPGLALDLDRPSDLDAFCGQAAAPRTASLLGGWRRAA